MQNQGYFEQLTDLQIDVLKEIGNIGTGNAATALSTMLSKPVKMAVPKVRMVNFQDMANILGGPENPVVGILFTMGEDIQGMIMFILEREFARMVVKLLMGEQFSSNDDMDEMELSALQEIGNIMAGAYVNAISALTKLKIRISVPGIAVDMAGAILSVPAIKFGAVGEKVMFIEGDYQGDGEHVKSYLLLIPERQSMCKMLQALGLEQ